jgi:hypothetical protein
MFVNLLDLTTFAAACPRLLHELATGGNQFVLPVTLLTYRHFHAHSSRFEQVVKKGSPDLTGLLHNMLALTRKKLALTF